MSEYNYGNLKVGDVFFIPEHNMKVRVEGWEGLYPQSQVFLSDAVTGQKFWGTVSRETLVTEGVRQ